MNILYEDTSIVVLDKPAGLSSEEGVPAALRQRWNAPDAFVGVVHRLDTGVSGLMVFAKTPGAAAALSRQITQSQNAYAVQDGRAEGRAEEPQFIKQYRAVIAGGPDEALPAEGTLRDWLFKDSRKGRVFPVDRPRKGVREAVLEYRILNTAGEMSLAVITLHTGRTHQIRAHMASIGCPILGDSKYGNNTANRELKLKYQALCAWELVLPRFTSPDFADLSGKTFRAPKPWYYQQVLDGTLK
mgnify:CR=1 FL=1